MENIQVFILKISFFVRKKKNFIDQNYSNYSNYYTEYIHATVVTILKDTKRLIISINL